MKSKDIITIVVSICILVVSGFFLYNMLFPSKPNVNTKINSEQTQRPTITGEIDTETLSKLKELQDYGEATLDNIGRANPFAPVN